MKIKYDSEVDVLLMILSEAEIVESDESREGLIQDYDAKGNVVRIEILDASEKGDSPFKLEYELVGR
jgi:uncharacterized protein YuzE